MRLFLLVAVAAGLGAGCELYLGPDGGPVACEGEPSGCTIPWDSDSSPCCDSTVWACNPDTAQWQLVYYCDPPGPVHVTGTLALQQTIVAASPGCPATTPTDPILLEVVDGLSPTLAAQAPAQVEWSELLEESGAPTRVDLQLADVWGGARVEVLYQLEADAAHRVTGAAGTSLGAGCSLTLDVTGTWGP